MGGLMNIHTTPISDLMVVESPLHGDLRGSFARLFCTDELAQVIGSRRILQINHSRTNTVGAIRGLHFQYPPYAEMKLVRCLKGRIWDLAIDLRRHSPTFLHWHAQELSPENRRMIVIPEGFGHGFQVLESGSELLYLHTAPYMPEAEGGLYHADPHLGIEWPLVVTDLSERDSNHPLTQANFHGIVL